jgi:membrane glycosyltransferase
MDAVINRHTPAARTVPVQIAADGSIVHGAPEASPDARAEAALAQASTALPPEAPLSMPTQSLTRFHRSERRKSVAPRLDRGPWLARLFVFGGAMAITAYGAQQMYGVVDVGGVTTLEWALLVLFVVNFSWIAVSFTSAVLGFLWLIFRRPALPGVPDRLRAKTAVVMPIYNEAPSRVFAALEAIREDVEATGLGSHFDYFFLSDTTDPSVWIAEERAFLSLRERLGCDSRVYYRHRPKNTNRKSGNIADFIMRWGGRYEHMVVLDADSLMSGQSIVALAAAMEADPDSGIIQSLPLVINRNTLFARVQQFAARVYGPVLASGLAVWSGRDGNYWGHNAIIRTAAFAAHCGLPNLTGKPPFGGHILSHDFVEAALMRRAGFAVYMLPVLGGSFEESPPSLIDLAARDRRWCQGNLQHIRVMWAKGFRILSRQHFASGIMGYVASPFWMAQLVVGIVLVFQSSYFRPEYFTSEFTLYPAWPRFDAERALALFGITMAILLAPKLFGLVLSLFDGTVRRACGGVFGMLASTVVEIVVSALLAPIMMLIQTGSVMRIVFGFDTGWNPQRRDDGSIPFQAIFRRHRSHMVMGFVTLFAAGMIAPSLVLWMSPTIAGLLLAVFLSWASGQRPIGLALKRFGLLITPEEASPPPIATRANVLTKELRQSGFDAAEPLRTVHDDPAFRVAHEAMLPAGRRRQRGDIEVDRALAEAKLGDAATVDEAVAWLKAKESMVVLNDRALIALLASLPEAAPAS